MLEFIKEHKILLSVILIVACFSVYNNWSRSQPIQLYSDSSDYLYFFHEDCPMCHEVGEGVLMEVFPFFNIPVRLVDITNDTETANKWNVVSGNITLIPAIIDTKNNITLRMFDAEDLKILFSNDFEMGENGTILRWGNTTRI